MKCVKCRRLNLQSYKVIFLRLSHHTRHEIRLQMTLFFTDVFNEMFVCLCAL